MTVLCLQLMTVIGGLLLLILSFRKFVARKLTEELGIIWIVMAFLFIVCGCFKRCFLWSTEMNIFDAIVLIAIVYLMFLIIFYMSMLLSSLQRKNQELAIMVSILNQENETIMHQIEALDELTITSEGKDEKEDIVCN